MERPACWVKAWCRVMAPAYLRLRDSLLPVGATATPNCGCSDGQQGISKPKISGCHNPAPGLYPARRALHGSPTEPGKEALVTGTFAVGSTTDANDDRLDRADNAKTPNPKRRR